MARTGNKDIHLYRYRKWKRFKDCDLDELREIDLKVQSGEIVLADEELVASSTGSKYVALDTVNPNIDPRKDDRIVTNMNGIRRFMFEAVKDLQVRGLLAKNNHSAKYMKQLYMNTNLKKSEVAFLFDKGFGELDYYLRRNGVTKYSGDMLHKVNNVETLIRAMERPTFEIMSGMTDETKEELYERYALTGYEIFDKIKVLLATGTPDDDTIKTLNTTVSVLNNNLKLEMEAKRLLVAEKEKAMELKERELSKNETKEPVIINFNNNIDSQDLFLAMQEILKSKGVEQEVIEAVMVDVAKESELIENN